MDKWIIHRRKATCRANWQNPAAGPHVTSQACAIRTQEVVGNLSRFHSPSRNTWLWQQATLLYLTRPMCPFHLPQTHVSGRLVQQFTEPSFLATNWLKSKLLQSTARRWLGYFQQFIVTTDWMTEEWSETSRRNVIDRHSMVCCWRRKACLTIRRFAKYLWTNLTERNACNIM